MEEKFIKFLISLNRINTKLKCLSEELDKLNANFIDEDFEKLFVAEQLTISPEDYN